MLNRRRFLRGAGVTAAGAFAAAATGSTAAAAPELELPDSRSDTAPNRAARLNGAIPYENPAGPRRRVVVVNDLGGDPDGLFATAHALLSTSARVDAIVATRKVYRGRPNPISADQAKAKGDALLKAMAIKGISVYAGSNDAMTSRSAANDSPGARAIIVEANRTDTKLPLFVTCGGALTDVASALLIDPSIAGKFTLVWIGGAAYPNGGLDTNLGDDPVAGQVVFNDTAVPIWQINLPVYAQAVISNIETQRGLLPCGRAGEFLWNELYARIAAFSLGGFNMGEAYSMGDNPLVLVTALGNAYDANTAGTTQFTTIKTPTLDANGEYTPNDSGRSLRLFTSIDTRLMFEDFFAKMQLRYAKR